MAFCVLLALATQAAEPPPPGGSGGGGGGGGGGHPPPGPSTYDHAADAALSAMHGPLGAGVSAGKCVLVNESTSWLRADSTTI
eukprot:1704585-Prymnesium_polylepis.1